MTPEERLVMYQLMREYVASQRDDSATDPENLPLTLQAKAILGGTADVEALERFRKFREELSRLEKRHGFQIEWDGTYTGIGKTVFVPEQQPQPAPQVSDDNPF